MTLDQIKAKVKDGNIFFAFPQRKVGEQWVPIINFPKAIGMEIQKQLLQAYKEKDFGYKPEPTVSPVMLPLSRPETVQAPVAAIRYEDCPF